MSAPVRSWNGLPQAAHAGQLALQARNAALPTPAGSLLAHGNGRSYGDSCLNDGGTVLLTRGLDRFIAFDRASGVLRCEAGVLLGDIVALALPQGWFLPVTPGTRHVTVGGAIANDVHGKNHHVAGSFGHHVRAFELLRSDGSRLLCGPDQLPQWFAATVGGLGLTGCIVWAELQLMPVPNPFMLVAERRFAGLDSFWELNAAAERAAPYTVAWIDCLARQPRGIFSSACHAPPQADLPAHRAARRRMPFMPPVSLVNCLSLRAFNALYYHRPLPAAPALRHHGGFFYPLDGVRDWNRIYGRRGFFQYQCVLPPSTCRDGIAAILARIAASGQGSFLAVLKTFGTRPPAGMLSFARPGATLALDFPNRGAASLRLFADLDAIVAQAGGALYPAKDARMPASLFRAGFPAWEAFSAFIDPRFSSSFWRRVNP